MMEACWRRLYGHCALREQALGGSEILDVILSVEALSHNLTGIGRYTWELAKRIPDHPDVTSLSLYKNDRWILDLADLMDPAARRPRSNMVGRWVRRRKAERIFRGRLFHGPNYFLPPKVDHGVVTVHDLSVFRYPMMHPAERVRQFSEKFSESLSRASHIITDAETVKQEIVETMGVRPDDITAIHLGIGEEFHPREGAELLRRLGEYGLTPSTYALCVCTIEPRKKILELIHAWRDLPHAIRSRWMLVISGGRGWLSDEIEAAMDRGEREGWLRYLGYVRAEDLPSLYAGASLFVYPSTYEGFGLPPLEAMASGVPTIVSNASCLPEVTQGGAMLIDPNHHHSLVDGIERGLTDEKWRATAAAEGIRIAQSYSWQRCAEKTVDVYQAVYWRSK